MVRQDACAMKVGTDGVLLGSWCPILETDTHLLDIGTGTGLIALMLAQRSKAAIHALDIDPEAAKQAEINFKDSPWCNRLEVKAMSIQEYLGVCSYPYDLVVSNPPYFNKCLKAPDSQRTLARHNDTLSLEELLQCSAQVLKQRGRLCVVLPLVQAHDCVKIGMEHGFHCSQWVEVVPREGGLTKRVLLELVRHPVVCSSSTLHLESAGRHHYTEAFTTLVKDFYLQL